MLFFLPFYHIHSFFAFMYMDTHSPIMGLWLRLAARCTYRKVVLSWLTTMIILAKSSQAIAVVHNLYAAMVRQDRLGLPDCRGFESPTSHNVVKNSVPTLTNGDTSS